MEAKTENLYNHVDFLTSIFPYRNYKNIESLQKTAAYIEKQLKEMGLPTARQKWDAKGNIYENVIATYQPHKSQRFIIGAHYDVYKEIAGADDNVSSVAGLLEISRMLAESSLTLDYGIDFVFFCLEEPPFFKTDKMGSYIHAKSIAKTNKNYIGIIALEMIGYYRETKIRDEDNSFHKNHARQLNEITKLVESEKIKTNIEKEYPLNDAVSAVLHVANGRTKGKVVINIK